MSLFLWFRRKAAGSRSFDKFGPLLVQVAVHECGTLQDVWQRRLDDPGQVALFAEMVIILVAVIDRLAFEKFGDPFRSEMMSSAVNTIRNSFANQSHFGQTRQDRVLHFERLFAERLQKFAACSSLMGEGEDSLLFTGARHLTEIFLADLSVSEFPGAVLETGKALSTSVLALLSTPPFKALSEVP